MSGPLKGVSVVEFSGMGPAPFCGMLLADMGADVICVERPADTQSPVDSPMDAMSRSLRRGKQSLVLDLKTPAGRDVALALIKRSDVLLEGFRPAVMEGNGLGPAECFAVNAGLIYGRMTGWGQDGPLAAAAGHDINYIALAGVLGSIGRAGAPPTIPLNLVGDFGGGALYLAMGICAALFERGKSGRGQVIDAAMVDGAISLMSIFIAARSQQKWDGERGSRIIDGASHFYNVFETSDGRYISIGAIEPKFHSLLREKLGLVEPVWDGQYDAARWPSLIDRLKTVFLAKTRDEWCALLEGSDVCFAPVLDIDELGSHPHIRARQSVIEFDGMIQSNVAPRFSRTPSRLRHPAPPPGAHTEAILEALGFAGEAPHTDEPL